MNKMSWSRTEEFIPAYLKLSKTEFESRIKKAFDLLSPCRLCPRKCEKDRMNGEKGVCQAGALPEVSSYNPVSYTHLTLPTNREV